MQSQIALWSTKYQKAPFVSFSLGLVLIIVISKNKRGCESNCNKRGKKRLATWFHFTFFKIIQFTPNTITCHTPFDFVKHLSVLSEPAEVRWISKCTSRGINGPTVPLTHPPNVWQTIQAAKQPWGRKDVEKLRSRSPRTKLLLVFLQKAFSNNWRWKENQTQVYKFHFISTFKQRQIVVDLKTNEIQIKILFISVVLLS